MFPIVGIIIHRVVTETDKVKYNVTILYFVADGCKHTGAQSSCNEKSATSKTTLIQTSKQIQQKKPATIKEESCTTALQMCCVYAVCVWMHIQTQATGKCLTFHSSPQKCSRTLQGTKMVAESTLIQWRRTEVDYQWTNQVLRCGCKRASCWQTEAEEKLHSSLQLWYSTLTLNTQSSGHTLQCI